MINKIKNKRVQLTLPRETAELLESLSKRYNKTSSEVVKWALNVLASKKQHIFTIRYAESEEKSEKEAEIKACLKGIVKNHYEDESEQWDKLLDEIEEANKQ